MRLPSEPLREIVSRLVRLRREGRLVIQAGDEGWASAPSNIALLKYWGKEPSSSGTASSGAEGVGAQIPVSSSLSRNLEGFRSRTRVVALNRLRETMTGDRTFPRPAHRFRLDTGVTQEAVASRQRAGALSGAPQSAQPGDWTVGPRLERFLEAFFGDWAPEIAVSIESSNNFPTACGVASSASGYSALVGALTHMAGLDRILPAPELSMWLSEWARLGSGSATRSAIATSRRPGFVAWQRHAGSNTMGTELSTSLTSTFEVDIHPDMAGLRHLLAVISHATKDTSSSAGHLAAGHSPFQRIRVAGLEERFVRLVRALKENDFEVVRMITEEDALSMHAVMATGQPPIRFMLPETVDLVEGFLSARQRTGWRALWTLDAGPNVHVLVDRQDYDAVRQFLIDWNEHRSGTVLSGDDVSPVAGRHGGICLGADMESEHQGSRGDHVSSAQ